MKKILAGFIILLIPFFLFSQKGASCAWINKLENSVSIERQLKLIQDNFESCSLILVEGIPLSSDTSSFYFGDLKLFIHNIKRKEIESINIIQGEAARTLYGTAGRNGIVLITLKKKKFMRKIQRRTTKQLDVKSKS